MAGLADLAMLSGMLIYDLTVFEKRTPELGGTDSRPEKIPIVQPSFVFDGGQQYQVRFSGDPLW